MNVTIDFAGQRSTQHIPPFADHPDRTLRVVAVAEADRSIMLGHFLRLSETDRRLRFMRIMSDDAVETHVAEMDFACNPRIALLNPVRSLVALAEGFVYRSGARSEMEVAFSTDELFRRQGLAKFLWGAMAELARDRGVERMVLHCDRRNTGMRGLLGSIGAATHVDASEVHAVWPVGAAC